MIIKDIGLKFNTVAELTDRTIDVGNAFGLGADDTQTFEIIPEDFEIDIRPGDVVFITGDSGGGKSLLLKQLKNNLDHKVFGFICEEALLRTQVLGDQDKALIDAIGNNTQEALYHLTYAGLNDAYIFLRQFDQLSDGQKYRYLLAKATSLSNKGKMTLFFDEFCSNLDRDTAKAVAYSFQKIVRENRITLICASANHDILDDLNPSILVKKYYGYPYQISYRNVPKYFDCSLLDKFSIRTGNKKDWLALERFHYRSGMPFGFIKIYVAEYTDEWNQQVLGGVRVYSPPPLVLAARNKVLGYVPRNQEVNRDFVLSSRTVVLPKFRGIGLGQMMVKECNLLVGKKYVEAMAVMARYNPFHRKAGMDVIEMEPEPKIIKVHEELELLGFNPKFSASQNYTRNKIADMSTEEQEALRVFLVYKLPNIGFNVSAGSHSNFTKEGAYEYFKDPENMIYCIRKIAVMSEKKVYLIWRNLNL
jgi:ABC-type lipoprotein export system ATPase subunit